MQPSIVERVYAEKARREKLRRDAKTSLIGFTQYTMPEFDCSWHHQVIADELDRWAFDSNAYYHNLILVAPPRHSKTELVSRRLPAYLFGRKPTAQFMGCTYGQDLANKTSRDVKRIIGSPQYREIFPETKLWAPGLGDDDGSKENTVRSWNLLGETGAYICAGVDGSITGLGFTHGVVDDPHKNMVEAMSETKRQAIWDWFWSDFWSRRAPGARVVVMTTRWHLDDLIGRLENDTKHMVRWRVIKLPAEMPADEKKKRKYDPREVGEYLWPSRYPEKELAPMKAAKNIWNAKYQCDPLETGGNIVKKRWLRRYDHLPAEGFQRWLMSVDCAFKKGPKTSNVSISMYGQRRSPFDAQIFLLDQVCEQLDILGTIREILGMLSRWEAHEDFAPFIRAMTKLVEDKANGPAVITMLKKKVFGLTAYTPKGTKEARLLSFQPVYEGGGMFYPAPGFKILGKYSSDWVDEHISEICKFPFSKRNDRVDCESQALDHIITRAFSLQFGRADEDIEEPGVISGDASRLVTHTPGPDPQSSFGGLPWESFGLF